MFPYFHLLYISFNSLQGNVAELRAGKSSGFKQETVVPLIISSPEILNLDFWLPLDLQIQEASTLAFQSCNWLFVDSIFYDAQFSWATFLINPNCRGLAGPYHPPPPSQLRKLPKKTGTPPHVCSLHWPGTRPVSYTHLTLPTKRIV